VGALPHSPQFADALAQKEVTYDNGGQSTRVIKVFENRISPLLVNGIITASLAVVGSMHVLPYCVICDALFLFMGLTGLPGNQLFERLKLVITQVDLYPPLPFTKEQVPPLKMHLFTLIQFAAAVVLFIVENTPIAVAFPVFLILTIPLRMSIPSITCGCVSREIVAILDGGEHEKEKDLETQKDMTT